ncbi:MarR family transcriptional regulator [Streptosporangium sp. NPDC051022]|uniref:MarR family winged helix-turn-helix transcriptional regulator n=1 Tax=Streptosporangium sp. NPDC051022 TaxID=3155752 RepID=UPI003445EDFC
MKHVHNHSPDLAHDPEGRLFDPQVRAALAQFIGGDNTLALEAATAVRGASHAIELMRSRGAHNQRLSSGALDILLRLGVAEGTGISIGDLAQAAGVTSRNVTGLVDTLEREGLAQRVPDPDDRRSVLVRITPAGQGWIASFRAPAQAGMAAVFREFSPAEIAQFRDLCLRLVVTVRSIEQPPVLPPTE